MKYRVYYDKVNGKEGGVMTVIERIDALLKERGMSRRRLAKKANIPPSTLQSAMERGKNISVDMLSQIADALDVSLFFLTYGRNITENDVEEYLRYEKESIAEKRGQRRILEKMEAALNALNEEVRTGQRLTGSILSRSLSATFTEREEESAFSLIAI